MERADGAGPDTISPRRWVDRTTSNAILFPGPAARAAVA